MLSPEGAAKLSAFGLGGPVPLGGGGEGWRLGQEFVWDFDQIIKNEPQCNC